MNPVVVAELGQAALEVGDLHRAQQMFRSLLLMRVITRDPATRADVFYHLGLIHHREGDDRKAATMLERAVALDPEHQGARELLAEAEH